MQLNKRANELATIYHKLITSLYSGKIFIMVIKSYVLAGLFHELGT